MRIYMEWGRQANRKQGRERKEEREGCRAKKGKKEGGWQREECTGDKPRSAAAAGVGVGVWAGERVGEPVHSVNSQSMARCMRALTEHSSSHSTLPSATSASASPSPSLFA